MKKPNSPPSVSVAKNPKSPPSLSVDLFAGESASDYVPDSLSPLMESVLSDQGSDYSIYTLKFQSRFPNDLKTDPFVNETPLCEQGLGFDESEAVSHRSDLLRGEGVGDSRSEGDVKNLSSCGVPPETANWENNEDPPWMTRHFL